MFSFHLFFPSRLTLCPYLSYFTHYTTRLLNNYVQNQYFYDTLEVARPYHWLVIILYYANFQLIIGLAYTANIPRGRYVSYFRGRCHCAVIACRYLLVNNCSILISRIPYYYNMLSDCCLITERNVLIKVIIMIKGRLSFFGLYIILLCT